MNYATVSIAPLTIKMRTPLHIGTGFRRGLVHRTILRDGNGQVYVPASSLKGRVRHTCESLLPTLNLPTCHAPYPQGLVACRRSGCLVCRVFGAPGQGSELFWHDAVLKDWPGSGTYGQTMTRTQVQLSRARGLAAEAHLYTGEASAPELIFESALGISGYMALTPVMGEPDLFYELILLLAGLKLVHTIGGETSRGLGHCTLELPDKIKVNVAELEVTRLLDNIEYLQFWGEDGEEEAGNGRA